MHHFPQLGVAELVILGILIFVLVPWGGRRGARRRQERAHAERMKALEMGLPVPGADPHWPRACTCIAIGAVAPLGIFVLAFLATIMGPENVASHGVIWGVAFLTSTVAIGCGTGLGFSLLGSSDGAGQPNPGA